VSESDIGALCSEHSSSGELKMRHWTCPGGEQWNCGGILIANIISFFEMTAADFFMFYIMVSQYASLATMILHMVYLRIIEFLFCFYNKDI
jgi:hypothetical protein